MYLSDKTGICASIVQRNPSGNCVSIVWGKSVPYNTTDQFTGIALEQRFGSLGEIREPKARIECKESVGNVVDEGCRACRH